MSISAVLIAKNEEKNIAECLKSLAFCNEMIVVDSGSVDKTPSIARAMGAKVFSNAFVDFSSQKNFAIQQASSEWILLVDADERVSAPLADEIRKSLEAPKADGYYLLRRNNIFRRWMAHGDNGNDFQLRLVRKAHARFEGLVHERIYLKDKPAKLKNPLLHYSTENLSAYMKKMNFYTSLEAKILNEKRPSLSFQRLHFRPFAVFLYRTFWQKGFLDGMEGFFYGVLSAYYEFVRSAKYWESAKKERNP